MPSWSIPLSNKSKAVATTHFDSGDYFDSQGSSSSRKGKSKAPFFALSKRLPLFHSDDEDEDDEQDSFPRSYSIESSSSMGSNNFPRTPSLESSSPSSLRRSITPSSTSRDPLISPPSPLLSPSYFTSAPINLELTVEPSTDSTRSNQPQPVPVSLLTRSLQLISQKLPNLSLTGGVEEWGGDWKGEWKGINTRTGAGMRISDLGSAYRDEEKWSPTPIKLSTFSLEARRLSQQSVDDFESSTAVVQLQTFSPPPSKKRSTHLSRTRTPSPPPPTPPVEPAVPRLISNPQHLLMLSLEFTMIKRGKITVPLRQRAYVFRSDKVENVKSSLSVEVVL